MPHSKQRYTGCVKSPDIAIQIVNYKTKAFLEPLLESVAKDVAGSSLAVEINILDNASGDDLTEIGKRWQKHNVHIYTSDKNRGFGGGHNLLANKTKAHYLLLLNPDLIFIEPQTVQRLLDTHQQSNADVVGPRLLTPKKRTAAQLAALSQSQLKQQPWDHGTYNIFTRYRSKHTLTEVAWVSGAVFLIERDTFENVGGFDEKFFLYYEEIDLCHRLQGQGKRTVYDPTIQVLHYSGGATGRGIAYGKHSTKSFLRFHAKRLKSNLKSSL